MYFFVKILSEVVGQGLPSSSYLIYNMEWMTFLYLGKLTYSFLSLDKLLTFYPLSFQWWEMSPRVLLM